MNTASVPESFARRVAEAPDAAAFVSARGTATYAGLDRRSDALARAFLAAAPGPGSRVGIWLAQGADSLAAVLAAAKAGLVAVPLDVLGPAAVASTILADCGASAVVHDAASGPSLPELPPGCIPVDAGAAPEAGPSFEDAVAGPDTPLQLVYTTGSTGVPKGVLRSHGNLAWNASYLAGELRVGRGDRFLFVAAHHTGNGCSNLFRALLNGATIIGFDIRAEGMDALAPWIDSARPTLVSSPASVMRSLVSGLPAAHVFAGVRAVVLTSERVIPRDIGSVRRHFGPGCAACVALSSTETGTFVSWVVPPEFPADRNVLPVGRPQGGAVVRLVDEAGSGVAAGQPGVAVVAGPGVALGYWNRPDLTANAFTPEGPVRSFRTGDLLRQRPDGMLEHRGRSDLRAKVLGHGVDLGGIEAAILAHPGVRNAGVVLRPDGEGGERLAAFVEADAASVPDLRRYLQARLPAPSVPSWIATVAALAVTANGKLDRAALAALPLPAPSGASRVAPRDATEERIAEIWAEVLGHRRFGVADAFHEVDGTSLSATRVVARIARAFGTAVPLRDFLLNPTIGWLASRVAGAPSPAPSDPPCPVPRAPGEDVPASRAQERLWFLEKLEPGSPVYNLPWALRVRGPFDEAAFVAALGDVVARHESLRTCLVESDGRPMQRIVPPADPVPRRLDLAGGEEALGRVLRDEARRPFDLARGPLIRLLLVALGPGDRVAMITMHHVISDRWSKWVLTRELSRAYAARASGKAPGWDPLPVQYADYARWQARRLEDPSMARQVEHWRGVLAGAPEISLPTDRPRREGGTVSGATWTHAFDDALVAGMHRFARDEGMSFYAVAIAGFAALLRRLTGEADVVVGTAIANRTHVELEGMIGFLVNTLALRVPVPAGGSFRELARSSWRAALEAYEHQDVPFDRLVEELRPRRVAGRHPLFDVFFLVQNMPAEDLALPGLGVEVVDVDSGRARFELSVVLSERAGRWVAGWEYDTDLFDAATIRRWSEEYRAVLRAALESPDLPMERLGLPCGAGAVAAVAAPAPAKPDPGAAAGVQAGIVLPPAPAHVGDVLAEIWCGLLGVASVTPEDDFFERGGHSLLAMRLVARVQDVLGVELPVRRVFEAPTLGAMASAVAACRAGAAGADGGAIPRVPRDRPMPMSFAQQRLWFVDRLQGGSAEYNMPEALHLLGPLDVDALRRAFEGVVRRHEALRTRFAEVDGQPVQVVDPADSVRVEMPVEDISSVVPSRRDAAVDDRLLEERSRPFDLAAGPLYRLRLLRVGPAEHVLLRVVHHAVSDGWSRGVMNREMSVLYAAEAGGRPASLPPLAVQYPDYAAWQRGWMDGPELARQVEHWRGVLAGAGAQEFPSDRPRPPRQTYRGGMHQFVVRPVLARRIAAFNHREGATPFMTLLAVFQVLVARHTGLLDVRVGTPIANRRRVELEPLIGFLVNMLVVRTDLSGGPSFREVVARVRRAAMDAYDHQDLPFERMVETLGPARDLSRSPFFQLVFAVHNMPMAPLELAGVTVSSRRPRRVLVRFDMELAFWPAGDGWECLWSYNADLFDASTIEALAARFSTLAGSLLDAPEAPALAARMLAPETERRLVGEWAGSAVPYPRDADLASLFEAVAARSPDAEALVDGARRWTYAELDREASRWAARLAAAGLAPGGSVGLHLSRSAAFVACVLGVLKAGGVYVPVPPDQPEARRALMLDDTGARVVATDCDVPPALAAGGRAVIDARAAVDAVPDAGPTATRPGGGAAAYVMYTSGSTGRPKGVVVPHRAVVRLVRGTDFLPWGPGLRMLVLAPVAFDASTLEIWGPLLNGGTCVVSGSAHPDPRELGAVIRSGRVNALWLTSGLFNRIVDDHAGILDGVDDVITGGEALSPAHVRLALERLPRLRLTNGYGPTESTTFACTHRIARDGSADGRTAVPIGRPIANTTCRVLGADGSLSPAGVPGELHVGGDGLAVGYLGDDAATAAKFVPDPWGAPGSRLYRTGDLCRWRADGVLEFLGRLDDQVKVRGHRVEPGEIEAVLATHPDVAQVAVVPRPDPSGGLLLAAVVVPRPGAGPAATALREHVASRLPSGWVPSVVEFRDGLPLTRNGKVDRAALRDAPVSAAAPASPRVPRTETESRLLRIWSGLLGRPDLGVDDAFFDVGGHSLLAIRLLALIEGEFPSRLRLSDLFEHPTVAGVAALIDAAGAEERRAPAVAFRGARTGAPVFHVPGRMGFEFLPPAIAAVLGASRPYYDALEFPGLDGRSEIPADAAAIAEDLVRQIVRACPEGPLSLTGHSWGGVLACEVARQLRASGRAVEWVVVFDSIVPGCTRPRGTPGFLAELWRRVRRMDRERRVPFLRALVSNKLGGYRVRLRREDAAPRVATEGRETDRAVLWEATERACTAFRLRPYDGNLAVLVATEREPHEGLRRVIPDDNGWGPVVRGRLDIHRVPCGHLQMVQEPVHPTVAAILRELFGRG